MILKKVLSVAVVVLISIVLCVPAHAVKLQRSERNASSQGEALPSTSIKKVTKVVKKIEGGYIYFEKERYDLRGAKVIDLSKGSASGKKKVAEMTFLNNELKEVVIR